MNRLEKHVIGALAAATVATAGLATAPPAAAMSWSCATRASLWVTYTAAGDAAYSVGRYAEANFLWGQAWGILGNCSLFD